jgi:hypothetical protein
MVEPMQRGKMLRATRIKQKIRKLRRLRRRKKSD